MKDTSFLDDILEPINTDAVGVFQCLSLDLVEIDPNQPRKHCDMASLQEMAESILQHGILQPITVTHLPGKYGYYQILTGERRYRAALRARDSGDPCARKGYDLSSIPALVVDAVDAVSRMEQQLVENLVREDMSPEDTGRALRSLLDATGCSVSVLARKIGKSAAWVRQALAFTDPALASRLEHLGVRPEQVPMAVAQQILSCTEDKLDWMRAQMAQGRVLDRDLLEDSERALAEHTDAPAVQVAASETAVESTDSPAQDTHLAGGSPWPGATPGDEQAQPKTKEAPIREQSMMDGTEDHDAEDAEGAERDGLSEAATVPQEALPKTYGDAEPPNNPEPGKAADQAPETPGNAPDIVMTAITLPENVWQILLVKAGVDGLVCADTVQQAIEQMERL